MRNFPLYRSVLLVAVLFGSSILMRPQDVSTPAKSKVLDELLKVQAKGKLEDEVRKRCHG